MINANPNGTPYILVSDNQVFLVVDKIVVCEVPQVNDLPFILLSAYFVFNICYPKDCNNLFSFMEIVTLQYPPNRASTTVKHTLSALENITLTA